jgi:cobalt-zinc-cadmium efflux system membrane fusion protein
MSLSLLACGRAPAPEASSRLHKTQNSAESGSGLILLAADSPKHQQIRTAEVPAVDVPQDAIVAPGKVAINPNRIARVVLPVPGRITSMEVRLGDAVTHAQSLLHMESPDAEEAMSDCLRAEAAQTQARATLSRVQADLERTRDLYEHGATARKEVLHAEAELATAEAAVKEAQAGAEHSHRRLSLLGLKPCEFGQQIVVRSPLAGKVLEINAVPGEYRNDTTAPVVTIADLNTVWVTSQVPESSIRWIHRGEKVKIELAAYPGELFEGRVMRIADTVDSETRSVEVQTELVNLAGRFRPEMFATIRHSHGSKKLPVVPLSSLVQAEGSSWIFVEDRPGRFRRTPVSTGEMIEAGVPILSGVNAGERVVVDGAVLLHEDRGGAN